MIEPLRRTYRVLVAVAGVSALAACGAGDEGMPSADATEAPPAPAGVQEPHTTLSAAERAEGWELLFDGTTTDAWRTYGAEDLHDGWQAIDGALVRVGGGGDIITRETYTDFELKVDWMVLEGGNSGIFIRASEESGRIFEGAPEVQVLDDAGANYAIHPAPRGVVRPAGEWNETRVRVEGNRVQQWLNGVEIVDYELGSPEWTALVAASKFSEWPEYGTYPTGHIGLQDHGDRVSFRNLKVRRIR